MSFMEKVRVVTMGALNDVLDKAIDMNSPSALRQYTRELEDALQHMKSDAATEAGRVHTYERERDTLQAQLNQAEKTVVDNVEKNPDFARGAAARVIVYRDQLKQKNELIARQKEASKKLDAAVEKVSARHQEVVAKLNELEQLDRHTKDMERVSAATERVRSITQTGADINVDNIESNMRARGDVAEEKFRRSMEGLDQDNPADSRVDDVLAELTNKQPEPTTTK